MKRTLTLLVLIGLVSGAMLTGCGDNSSTSTPPAKPDAGKADAGTTASNAAPAAPK